MTVIEGAVAISILLICVLGVINLFPWSLQVSKSAELKTLATNLAQEKIEELIALDYEEVSVGTIESRHSLESPFSNYQRETTVNYVDTNLDDNGSDQGMKKIMVIVYWSSQISGDSQIQINTLISQL